MYNVPNKYLVPYLSVLSEADDGLIFCRMPQNTRFKGSYTQLRSNIDGHATPTAENKKQQQQ